MTKFIAEISSNHNSNLNRCKKLIDEAKKLNCYAVKFQVFKTNKLFHEKILNKSKPHRNMSKWELPSKFVPILSRYAKKKKIKFSISPFYLEAVDKFKKYVDFFKIGSYEILREDLLKSVAKTKKKIILSTGMANESEIKKAITILKKNGCKNLALLHCVSQYPAKIEDCNLKSIKYLSKKFKLDVGWSDHTRNPLLVFHAIQKFGAKYIEFHFDLEDKKGYEAAIGHCWTPKEAFNLLNFLNYKNKIEGNFKKYPNKNEKNERNWRSDPTDGLRPLSKIRKSF